MEEARGGGLIAFTLEANIVVFFLGGGERERERDGQNVPEEGGRRDSDGIISPKPNTLYRK
jgi:hypothetical protein